MAFDWSRVGSAPSPDEIEVTLIGPGFGESIVVHVGRGCWIVVDSCVDSMSSDTTSAPLNYLHHIGVNCREQVQLVVATHWHEDHVKGISQLVSSCESADFCCASALTSPEFLTYLAANDAEGSADGSSKPQEFFDALQIVKRRRQVVRLAMAGNELSTFTDASHKIFGKVVALSPSHAEVARFMQWIGKEIPSNRKRERNTYTKDPNELSVVVQVLCGDDSILLGADMVVTNDVQRGWKAVMQEHRRLVLPQSNVVKVPHHGSENAHFQNMWNDGCHADRIALVAPYSRGVIENRPPKLSDIQRILKNSPRSYITAPPRAKRAKFEPAVERTITEGFINVTNATQALGMVRVRKKANGSWVEQLFPPAIELSKAA